MPEAFRFAVIRPRLERVDGARTARPGIGADRDGIETGRPVVGNGADQRVHVQSEAAVGGHLADVLRPDADDPGRPDLGAVALVAHVDGGCPAASRAATKASRLAAVPPLVRRPPAVSG